ncbi:MAG: CPn0927/CPn0928 family alpha/beta hydrolase fold protein [Chlamydiales bacterium]
MSAGSVAVGGAGHVAAFREVLDGRGAFYNAPDYEETTRRDLASGMALPATYVWNTEYKIIRIVKQILMIIIFPIAIYQFLHALAAKIALLPASFPQGCGLRENHANESRARILLNDEWKYKRITIEVDDYKIDAAIVGKASTLANGRWVLASNGNCQFYEDLLSSRDFKQILSEVRGNAIVFNYPGVGASSGLPNRGAMAKAYRALLAFLEDRERGIGAREIIGFGHSIGGGVQGDALKTHLLMQDVRYVFVKNRTFSNLATTASMITGRPSLERLVRVLGWNIDSVESSKRLQAPEIIMQTACVNRYVDLVHSAEIIHDGVIPEEASLARALLDDNECPKANKTFIGMSEYHNDGLVNPAYLAGKIEAYLAPSAPPVS